MRRATGNDYNYYSLAGNSAETNPDCADAYATFTKSFDGELCYKDDDRSSWGLFSCRKRSGGGCIVVEGESKSQLLPCCRVESRQGVLTLCSGILQHVTLSVCRGISDL